MKKILVRVCGLLLLAGFGSWEAHAWDYEGHRLVNQLALASLPADFPGFALTAEARERIAFLGGEPDRWRNTHDLNHFNGPDHYIDLDQLEPYGLDPASLTPFRYDFTAQLALARAAHPDRFPRIDPAANLDHTRQLVGFLPWAITENFEKLKSGFSYLKALEEDGTPEEAANARQNILYIMGVLGHYVGDSCQPLHTTMHHHGWVGLNPNNYTREKNIHSRVDGYFRDITETELKLLLNRVRPAEALSGGGLEGAFSRVNAYLMTQFKQVEPLYQLEKAGKLFGQGDAGRDGKLFLENQLLTGGQMLGNLWLTAWKQAEPDMYLKSQLAKRKLARQNGATGKP